MINDQDRFPIGTIGLFFRPGFFGLFRGKEEGVFNAHFFSKKVGSAGFESTILVLPTTPYVKVGPLSHSSGKRITVYQSKEFAS